MNTVHNAIQPIVRIAVLLTALLGMVPARAEVQAVAHDAAQNANPLAVPDQSSPRAVLDSFLAVTDSLYIQWARTLLDYLDGDTLYLSREQRQNARSITAEAQKLARMMDLSGVPPALKNTLTAESVLQFREILDRIPLPPPASIPDKTALGNNPAKRWRLPDTDIEFIRIDEGLRTGDYVLSAETIERLPTYYASVRNLPYKPGAGLTLFSAYRRFDPESSSTIYERFTASPAALGMFLPMRWILAWPEWTRASAVGLAIWQWIGLAIGLALYAAVLVACHRVSRRLAELPENSRLRRWHSLPLPAGILVVAGLLIPGLCFLLHLGNLPRIFIATMETVAFSMSGAWLAVAGTALLGELVVGVEYTAIRSLDTQLIRLGFRMVGVAIAIACLMRGADQLGIPAYSVMAGLGVSGIAVALAAKDSLANLLGSIMIMFEKPFRVGQYIRLAGYEGTVEDVGFRSTRIRTPNNSLISIPNDSVINTTVENLSVRPRRRQRLTLSLTYDTPRKSLVAFVDGVRALIEAHQLTAKEGIQVSLHNLADSSVDVLVIFHLAVVDYTSELRGRHEILLQIIALAEDIGLAFAFPTRTLIIETGGEPSSAKAIAMAAHG